MIDNIILFTGVKVEVVQVYIIPNVSYSCDFFFEKKTIIFLLEIRLFSG